MLDRREGRGGCDARRLARRIVLALSAATWLGGCSQPDGRTGPLEVPPTAHRLGDGRSLERSVDEVARNPLKDVFFGDLHVHTSWSLDAFAFGVRVGPEDAYRYARGEAIDHVSGSQIRMKGPPLDFIALTEHANYMGIPSSAQDPESPIRRIPLIQGLLSSDPGINARAMERLFAGISSDTFIPELSPERVIDSTWQELVALADRHDTPGEFTAFVGYEYTSMPDGQNLHRNVIFRGSDVPARPFSSFDSQDPADLWAWMEAAREVGSDVLTIPHNGNASNGLMYPRVDARGEPISVRDAEVRLRNEPVSEVIQIKGQSETHPALSPEDEWARFEILETILGRPADKSRPRGSYARRALMDGLELEEAGEGNPYRFGMIGSSDGHNASSPVEEDNYTGKIGVVDGTPRARLGAGASDLDLEWGDRNSGSPFGAA